jgi:hypothetical protein
MLAELSRADLLKGGHMIEREKIEREIHQLTQIIAADAFALASRSTTSADRAGLQKQIEIRSALWAGLLKQLSGVSSLSTAELRGPREQAKAYPRSEANEGSVAANLLSPASPH